MTKHEISLTPTEWHLMECLWEHSPRTGREAVEHMSSSVGWTRSTTLTMLRRMTEKGYIVCNDADGLKSYSPAIERREAVLHETEDFLGRVYHGSLSMMLSAMTEKSELSRDEIAELYDILKKAEEASKK